MLGWTYVFAEAVNKIDGVGRSGAYELTFCAKDNGPKYVNCARTAFQIAESNLSPQLGKITTILDSLLAVLDTLQNQDDWVSSFDPIGDSARDMPWPMRFGMRTRPGIIKPGRLPSWSRTLRLIRERRGA